MNNKKTSISINVLSVLVILMCLFMVSISSVNSWFSVGHNKGIQISVFVGDLKLKVFQDRLPTADELLNELENNVPPPTEIFTNERNANENTTAPQYIKLSSKIEPDVAVPLTLFLSNNDEGVASVYVRFKFEIYVRGISSDKPLDGVRVGFDSNGDKVLDENPTTNFVYNNGYYYYQNGGNNMLFAQGSAKTMLTHFSVPLTAFYDEDGNKLYTNSDSVYIKLTVQGDIVSNFANCEEA